MNRALLKYPEVEAVPSLASGLAVGPALTFVAKRSLLSQSSATHSAVLKPAWQIHTSVTMPAHLEQQKLSEYDKNILEQLQNWLLEAKFEKQPNTEFELCKDDGLSEKWRLLGRMQLVQNVRQF